MQLHSALSFESLSWFTTSLFFFFLQGLKVFEDATENGRIVYKSEVWVSEITLKYEQVKALQNDLGEQILRLWDIMKSVFGTYDELVTKINEYGSRIISSLSRCLVWNAFSCAGSIGLLSFASAVGSVLSIAGSGLLIAEQLKFLCSAKRREEEDKLVQLLIELQQKAGQLKEAFHVFDTKLVSFMHHLKDITEFCHEHPNELILMRECGQVSTQQVLRDISTFMSTLEEFTSTASNSREIHEKMIVDGQGMALSREVGVIEDGNDLTEDGKVMKFKRLLMAPIILTTGKMNE